MKRHLSLLLFAILLGACGYPAGATNTPVPPTETATAVPTATPTPAPVEVAPGEFIPASQIDGFEARDESGKLIYVEGINSEWIKASYEIAVPPATAEDWAAVNGRLGTDFVINSNGTVKGVEGLNVNKETGAVTFDFDGGGVENYHIQNIKVQKVDGVNRLLVAGYMWNGETKSWEVFNPGFPMESPEAQLGWFVQADVANGNWLRFHQRALETLAKQGGFASVDEYLKELFKNAMRPDAWRLDEAFSNKQDRDHDGTKETIHRDSLSWISGQYDNTFGDFDREIIKKEQWPGRGGLSYGYFVDAKTVIISFDAINGDETKTSLPMILDDVLWTKYRDTAFFTRVALASGHEWDETMKEETTFANANQSESWVLWPVVLYYSDTNLTLALGQNDLEIVQEPDGIARRQAAIAGDQIASEAGLEIWGAFSDANYNE